MIETFSIPLTFILIVAIALWIIIGSKGWWVLKASTVLIACWFSVFLWNSLADIQGWPTEKPMPPKFEVKWTVVEEPNKKTDSAGAVYFWIIDLNPEKSTQSYYMKSTYGQLNGVPRVHKMPYSKKLHQLAVDIQQKIAKGGKFFGGNKGDGKKGKGDGNGKGDGDSEGKKGGKGGKGGMTPNAEEFNLYELPPPHLPPKDVD